jgi:REP-associated tyrosine transposase
MAEQQTLRFRTRGGKRRGAGRPRTRERAGVPHTAREPVRPYQPVHVTIRMADFVWNLRSERSFAVIHHALEAARHRPDSRIVHFTILGNHLHLIVEAMGEGALANSMRALSIRIARRLNRMMGRSGPVVADRYHAHVLRTPTEVRNAVRYVLGNFAGHAARRGERVPPRWVDPFSSTAMKSPRNAQGSLFPLPVTVPAATWLLRRQGDGKSSRADPRIGRAITSAWGPGRSSARRHRARPA